MILPPIAHVGMREGLLDRHASSSAAARPRKGPPEAVRTSGSTVPGRSPARSWCSAACSESTGIELRAGRLAQRHDELAADDEAIPCWPARRRSPSRERDDGRAEPRRADDGVQDQVGVGLRDEADEPLRPGEHLAVRPRLARTRRRVWIRQRDTPHAVRACLGDERLVRALGRQADDLEGVARPRHHVQRLGADRARRAEDEQPLHRRAIVAAGSSAAPKPFPGGGRPAASGRSAGVRAGPGGYGAGMGRHGKPDDTVVHGLEPFNAEPPRTALAERAVTPVERFYVRNHGPVPALDADALRLTVGGLVERPLELVARRRCAPRLRPWPRSPRRCSARATGGPGSLEVRAIPGEAPWGPGATGTAIWRGVRLADVLAAAGVRAGAAHVALIGADSLGGDGPAAAVRHLDPAGEGRAPRGPARLGDERGAAAGRARRAAAGGRAGLHRRAHGQVAAAHRAGRRADRGLLPGRRLPAAGPRRGAGARAAASCSARSR